MAYLVAVTFSGAGCKMPGTSLTAAVCRAAASLGTFRKLRAKLFVPEIFLRLSEVTR